MDHSVLTFSCLLQTPSTDAVQKPSIQHPLISKIPKFETADAKSDSIIPNVIAESKSKPTSIRPNASISTLNKDIKSGTKDTFLNKDPRTANKRISPVPKSMAMLAAQSKDRVGNSSHDVELVSVKSNLLKHKPTSPTKVRKPMSPLKGIPEIPIPSPADGPKLSSSSTSSTSSLEPKTVKVSADTKPIGQSKKELNRIPKKSISSSKIDRSPKPERKLPTIPKYSDSKRSLTKSHKEGSKPISKDLKKGLDSKKKEKDRKRDTENLSGSKTALSKSKADIKSGRVFKDIKSCRSRNYKRRNQSLSESPEPPPESGDVDLRTSALPDKIPRIAVFKDEPDALNAKPGMSPPGPPFQIEGNKIASKLRPLQSYFTCMFLRDCSRFMIHPAIA